MRGGALWERSGAPQSSHTELGAQVDCMFKACRRYVKRIIERYNCIFSHQQCLLMQQQSTRVEVWNHEPDAF